MTSARFSERDLVRVALIGMMSIAVVLVAAINFQRLPLVGAGDTYQAEFSDAAGLVAGEEVRIAGIKVGTVTGIELGHKRVNVSFTVKGVELGSKTTAGIEVKTLLGQHYLSVAPAGPGRLDAGTPIPLERTTTPVNIVPAFQRLATTIEDIDTAQIAEAFDALSETLSATAPEMEGTLRGLSRLSRSVSSRDVAIRELFSRANQVSGVVAARDADLARLLTDTNTVLAVLDRRRTTIQQIIEGTTLLSRELTGLVEDTNDDLLPMLTKLNGVLEVLRANEREIDRTIRLAEVYGQEFVNVGGSGRWFDATMKFPRGMAVCRTEAVAPALTELFDPALGGLNQAVNGSDKPCLPLGPATGKEDR